MTEFGGYGGGDSARSGTKVLNGGFDEADGGVARFADNSNGGMKVMV